KGLAGPDAAESNVEAVENAISLCILLGGANSDRLHVDSVDMGCSQLQGSYGENARPRAHVDHGVTGANHLLDAEHGQPRRWVEPGSECHAGIQHHDHLIPHWLVFQPGRPDHDTVADPMDREVLL